MRILSMTFLGRCSTFALLPLFAACSSVAPGMHLDAASASELVASDISPAIKTITPQLLKAEREQREQQVVQDVSRLVAPPLPYDIQSGDILSIVVWEHPELAGAVMQMPTSGLMGGDAAITTSPPAGFVVDHEGMVQFPYAGALKLAGLTEEQARNSLISKLARYINNPKVTLRVQSYRSKRIYIDGEVKSPGLQAINDIPMTLIESLNRAGGLLPTADQSRIYITRGDAIYQINLLQLVQKGINPASIMLAHGDVVRAVSRDESKVFVSGEVTTPKALTMHNGRLTLNEALGESGGINSITGDGKQVYVVRKSGSERLVYQLDASSPSALAMAEGFELNPKDVVYVAASGLANWHRSISLLLPGPISSLLGPIR